MATLEALNIKAIEQIDRIEAHYKRVTGREVTPMRRAHKDIYMLRLEQLRTIADWLEHMQPVSDDNGVLETARELARSGATKADIVAVLLGDDNGNPDS